MSPSIISNLLNAYYILSESQHTIWQVIRFEEKKKILSELHCRQPEKKIQWNKAMILNRCAHQNLIYWAWKRDWHPPVSRLLVLVLIFVHGG